MLLKSFLFSGVGLLSQISLVSALVDVISNPDATEFGAYVNPNPKNICEGDELETLTICASEVLSKLDECKPDDLACECCALQSMKRDCYGLCPNTASGNFLAVLYDDCETMNDVNACNLPFKKHDAHIAKFLRPNAKIPVEEKEPDFILQSTLEHQTLNESSLGYETQLFDSESDVNVSSNATAFNSTNSTIGSGVEENRALSSTTYITGWNILFLFGVSFSLLFHLF